MSRDSSKQQGETSFSVLLVVFSVTAFWQSYAISGFSGLSTAGAFPMLASATMLVSAICILLQSFRCDSPGTRGSIHRVFTRRLVIMVLLITGYLFAMPALGFILASTAFMFLSFSYLWQKSLVVSALITLVSISSVYFIFRKLFQVVLPKGTWIQGLLQ